MNILDKIGQAQMDAVVEQRAIPEFGPGDTVKISVKVVEGSRERVQAFEGVCIGRSNRGINSSFTVRKISYGEGVERVFPLYSPKIQAIEVVRRGEVRRAKLYYLRGRTGKAARIAERQSGHLHNHLPSRHPDSCASASLLYVIEQTGEMADMPAPKTLFDKIWDAHLVHAADDGTCLIYIDRHLVHEVTSPQAFEGLRTAGRKVRSPERTLAVADHNVPTTDRSAGIEDEESRIQVAALETNAAEFGVPYFGMTDIRQGIVHVIGPEQGFTQPGMTIVCGDSHTATHGAFGALAFGIGTSEVEHVLATQTLIQQPAKNMRITVDGQLSPSVTAKDIILAIIGKIGTAGGTGHVIEFAGEAIQSLSMEGRMTVCNMAIEAGARAGMIAPDEKTFAYLEGRPMAPTGEAWDKAVAWWRSLPSDEGAQYDTEVVLKAEDIAPTVTWGTSPEDALPITATVPDPAKIGDAAKQAKIERALDYMGLSAGMKLTDIKIDTVFIGSCTNSRIEDLRAAASVAEGRKVKDGIRAMIVPGSGLVKQQAEDEGLDQIFIASGFEWREPGCSMCLAMNADKLEVGERCASTSNRNFEGRQGRGGRTHLVSPEMAVAAALNGHLCDVREL